MIILFSSNFFLISSFTFDLAIGIGVIPFGSMKKCILISIQLSANLFIVTIVFSLFTMKERLLIASFIIFCVFSKSVS